MPRNIDALAWHFPLLPLVLLATLAGPGAIARQTDSQRTKSAPAPRSAAAPVRDVATPRLTADEMKFANGLLGQRKFDLAAEEFERLLASGVQGAYRTDALYGLANARLYQGKYPEARKAFSDFLATAPKDTRGLTARYRLGELAYFQGDFAEARQSLETFTSSTNNHPALETAWTYLADARFASNDLPGARKAYEASLAAYPRGRMTDRASFGLGRCLAALGDIDRARSILKKLAEQGQPEWVDQAWLEIGSIELGKGRAAEALAAFDSIGRSAQRTALQPLADFRRAQALVLLNRKDEAEILLRRLAAGKVETPAARAALELATLELGAHKPAPALTTLKLALERFPETSQRPALLFRSAEALLENKQPTDAEAKFSEVYEKYPDDPWADDALYRAAELALNRRDPSTALKRADKFLERFPESDKRPEVRLTAARACAQAGQFIQAIAMLEPLLERGEQMPDGHFQTLAKGRLDEARYQLALIFRSAGQKAKSDTLLKEIAEGQSGSVAADAQFLLGQEHLEAARFAEALPLLQRYLEANPRGEVADYALADLLAARLGLGQTDEAKIALAQLAERFPASHALSAARMRMAEAALAAHRADEAVSLFELVAHNRSESNQPATSPESPSRKESLRLRALTGLGKGLNVLGKPAEAAAAFAAALQIADNDASRAELAILRGQALEAAQQDAAALDAYADAAQRFSTTKPAKTAALARARLLVKRGRHTEAALAYEQLIGADTTRKTLPADEIATDALLVEWGWALVDAAKPAEADRVFQRLLADYPQSPYAADARFNLAESANVARNYPEVIRLLEPMVALKASREQPKSPSGTPGQDKVVTPSGPASGASTTSGPAINDDFQRLLPAVLYRLGRTYTELKEWRKAAEVLDRLLHDFAGGTYDRGAQALRAEAALRLGDVASAESMLTTLLTQPPQPTDPPFFVRSLRHERIQSWVALKRWKDVLDAATTLRNEFPAGNPAVAELDYSIGQALLGQGKLAEARSAFQSVIDSRRSGDLAAQAQLMRGETFYHQEQFREALREFLRVEIMYDAPQWQATALLEAGKVYERLDQWPDAAEIYERLIKRFPSERAASQARERKAAASQRTSAPPADKK